MIRTLLAAAFALAPLALALGPAARASDLSIKVQSQGASSAVVAPGAQVPYRVLGELSDSANEGLAMFCLDLAFSGGPLAPAVAPSQMPMLAFVPPQGLANPGGYGGTVAGGILKQVGGAQNTIKNTIAPIPIGNVVTGVAWPGAPATLATGSLGAPYAVGSYALAPGELFANVIRQGATGNPFWKVDAAGVGALAPLTVRVEAIVSNTQVLSVAAGGRQALTLRAGPANAGRSYLVLGTLSGTAPGVNVGGSLVLPLVPDEYFRFTRANPNSAILGGPGGSLGRLDGQGNATCTFHPTARFVGSTAHHAFLLLGPVDFVSEAEPVKVVP